MSQPALIENANTNCEEAPMQSELSATLKEDNSLPYAPSCEIEATEMNWEKSVLFNGTVSDSQYNLIENATMKIVEKLSESNAAIESDVPEGHLESTNLNNEKMVLPKEYNECVSQIISEHCLESTLLETSNNGELSDDPSYSKPIRSSFSDNYFPNAESKFSNNVGVDPLTEKLKHRRSAVIESFSPISEVDKESFDCLQMDEILSGKCEASVPKTGKSLIVTRTNECKETAELDTTEESESASIMVSSYVVNKAFNFSPVVSSIDASPNVSGNGASYDTKNSVFLSPTSNPLNQTFKQLPEVDSFNGDEDSDFSHDELVIAINVEKAQTEFIEKILFPEILNETNKSLESVYHDCVPDSFHIPMSPMLHVGLKKTEVNGKLLDHFQEASEDNNIQANFILDVYDKSVQTMQNNDSINIKKIRTSSSDDSGPELDKSPGVAKVSAACPHCQTSTLTSLECSSNSISEVDHATVVSVNNVQSQLQTEIAQPSLSSTQSDSGHTFRYFEDLTEGQTSDEQQSNISIKGHVMSTEQEGNDPEELISQLPLMDSKARKYHKDPTKLTAVRETKPPNTKKPNSSMTQGSLHSKPSVNLKSKALVEVSKKLSTAGGTVTKGVTPTVKSATASSRVLPKNSGATASSKAINARRPEKTTRFTPVVKPNCGTGSATAAAALSSRATSASSSVTKKEPVTLIDKQRMTKSVTSSSSVKPVGAAKPISRTASTGTKSARVTLKRVDPLKSSKATTQKVSSPLPSSTAQLQTNSTSQEIKKTITQATSKPKSSQATSNPVLTQARSKPTATVVARSSASNSVPKPSQKIKSDPK